MNHDSSHLSFKNNFKRLPCEVLCISTFLEHSVILVITGPGMFIEAYVFPHAASLIGARKTGLNDLLCALAGPGNC